MPVIICLADIRLYPMNGEFPDRLMVTANIGNIRDR